jgi:excisionase family DNA binding protein
VKRTTTSPRLDPLLMTYEQVCIALAVSRPTLEARVRAGHLRPTRIGYRTVRFSRADVDAYIARMHRRGGRA